MENINMKRLNERVGRRDNNTTRNHGNNGTHKHMYIEGAHILKGYGRPLHAGASVSAVSGKAKKSMRQWMAKEEIIQSRVQKNV
jgi:hypothetical protein